MRIILIKSLLRFFSWLPLPVNHALGALWGALLAVVPNDLRTTTHANLQRCFPEMNIRDRRRLAWRSLVETGKTITETGPMWLWKSERVLGLLKDVENRALADACIAKGEGLIFATPHLGCWEMAGLWGANHYGMTTLYRRPRLEALDQLIRNARERAGTHYVPAGAAGVRALYHALGKGQAVGMLPDQDPGDSGGSFAPFFGVPAYTMVLLSRLTRKTGAPVIFAYCERLPWGSGYRLVFRETPLIISNGSLDESVIAVNQAVEECVRALPTQYQWGYKRFKTRPKDAE